MAYVAFKKKTPNSRELQQSNWFVCYNFFFYRFNYSYDFVHEFTLSFKQAHSFQFTMYIKLIYVHRAEIRNLFNNYSILLMLLGSYLSVLLTRNRLSYRSWNFETEKYNNRKRRRTTEKERRNKKKRKHQDNVR